MNFGKKKKIGAEQYKGSGQAPMSASLALLIKKTKNLQLLSRWLKEEEEKAQMGLSNWDVAHALREQILIVMRENGDEPDSGDDEPVEDTAPQFKTSGKSKKKKRDENRPKSRDTKSRGSDGGKGKSGGKKKKNFKGDDESEEEEDFVGHKQVGPGGGIMADEDGKMRVNVRINGYEKPQKLVVVPNNWEQFVAAACMKLKLALTSIKQVSVYTPEGSLVEDVSELVWNDHIYITTTPGEPFILPATLAKSTKKQEEAKRIKLAHEMETGQIENMPARFLDIFKACRHGYYDSVKKFLEAGAPVDGRDEVGNTCLMVASQNNHKRIVKLLLRNAADIDAKNYKGMTALHYCGMFAHDELGAYLISLGANYGDKSNDNMRFYDRLADTKKAIEERAAYEMQIEEMRAAATIQKAWRGYFMRKAFLRNKRAAKLVANAIRRYNTYNRFKKCLKFLKRERASIKLQAYWRRYLAEEFYYRLQVVIRLQANVRMKQARTRYLFLRSLCRMQGMVRGNQTRLKLRRFFAANMIQAWFRGCRVRIYVFRWRRAREIQKVFRGYLYYTAYKRYKAAVKIQKIVRGWIHRKDLTVKWITAIRLQRAFRRHRGRVLRNKFFRAIDRINKLHYQRTRNNRRIKNGAHDLVDMIAQWWRMAYQRRRFNRLYAMVISCQITFKYRKVRKACTLLQTYFRGFRARREARRRLLAVIQIQSAFRMKRIRIIASKKLWAIIALQRFIRQFNFQRRMDRLRRWRRRTTESRRNRGAVPVDKNRSIFHWLNMITSWRRMYPVRREYRRIVHNVSIVQARFRGILGRRMYMQKSIWRNRMRYRTMWKVHVASLIGTRLELAGNGDKYEGGCTEEVKQIVARRNERRLARAVREKTKFDRFQDLILAGTDTSERKFKLYNGAILTIQSFWRSYVVRRDHGRQWKNDSYPRTSVLAQRGPSRYARRDKMKKVPTKGAAKFMDLVFNKKLTRGTYMEKPSMTRKIYLFGDKMRRESDEFDPTETCCTALTTPREGGAPDVNNNESDALSSERLGPNVEDEKSRLRRENEERRKKEKEKRRSERHAKREKREARKERRSIERRLRKHAEMQSESEHFTPRRSRSMPHEMETEVAMSAEKQRSPTQETGRTSIYRSTRPMATLDSQGTSADDSSSLPSPASSSSSVDVYSAADTAEYHKKRKEKRAQRELEITREIGSAKGFRRGTAPFSKEDSPPKGIGYAMPAVKTYKPTQRFPDNIEDAGDDEVNESPVRRQLFEKRSQRINDKLEREYQARFKVKNLSTAAKAVGDQREDVLQSRIFVENIFNNHFSKVPLPKEYANAERMYTKTYPNAYYFGGFKAEKALGGEGGNRVVTEFTPMKNKIARKNSIDFEETNRHGLTRPDSAEYRKNVKRSSSLPNIGGERSIRSSIGIRQTRGTGDESHYNPTEEEKSHANDSIHYHQYFSQNERYYTNTQERAEPGTMAGYEYGHFRGSKKEEPRIEDTGPPVDWFRWSQSRSNVNFKKLYGFGQQILKEKLPGDRKNNASRRPHTQQGQYVKVPTVSSALWKQVGEKKTKAKLNKTV